jgi:hypothetical protein
MSCNRAPADQLDPSNRYFKAKMFEMFSRLAISLAV